MESLVIPHHLPKLAQLNSHTLSKIRHICCYAESSAVEEPSRQASYARLDLLTSLTSLELYNLLSPELASRIPSTLINPGIVGPGDKWTATTGPVKLATFLDFLERPNWLPSLRSFGYTERGSKQFAALCEKRGVALHDDCDGVQPCVAVFQRL